MFGIFKRRNWILTVDGEVIAVVKRSEEAWTIASYMWKKASLSRSPADKMFDLNIHASNDKGYFTMEVRRAPKGYHWPVADFQGWK